MISAMNLTREAKTLSTKLVSKVIFCAVLDPIPYIYHATYSTTVLDPSILVFLSFLFTVLSLLCPY